MRKTTAINISLIAALFLFTGVLAVAQTAPAAKDLHPREAGSAQASGRLARKDGAISHADFPRSANARNSGHATEPVNPSNNAAKDTNPLYQGSGMSGTNPLNESHSRADSKPQTSNTQNKSEFKQDFGPMQGSKK